MLVTGIIIFFSSVDEAVGVKTDQAAMSVLLLSTPWDVKWDVY